MGSLAEKLERSFAIYCTPISKICGFFRLLLLQVVSSAVFVLGLGVVSFVGVLMMVVPVEHRGFADGE